MNNLIPSLVVSLLCSSVIATTWTVDDDGKADFDNIQAAIDAASDGDEIIVSAGTYTSSQSRVVIITNKSVWLHSSDGAEVTILDGQFNRGNIYCVGQGASKTVIEGFTLRNGNAAHGAGIYCDTSSMTVRDSIFVDNLTIGRGGGSYCISSTNVTFDSCTFTDNYAKHGGGLAVNMSDATLTNCLFDLNNATGAGGAIRLYPGGAIAASDCEFLGNTADIGGGLRMMENLESTTFDHCLFSENLARKGGGVASDASTLDLTNCVFSENTAVEDQGGGVSCSNKSNVALSDTYFCANYPNHLNVAGGCNIYDAGQNGYYDNCCTSDLNYDRLIDINDLLVVIADWHCDETDSCENFGSDINEDGVVDVLDILVIIADWGVCE